MNPHLIGAPAGLAAGALAVFLLSGGSPGFEQARARFHIGSTHPSAAEEAAAAIVSKSVSAQAAGTGGAPVSLATLRALIDLNHPVKTDARLYRLLEGLPPEKVAALAKEAMRLPEEDRQRYLLMNPLQEIWAKLDPAEAVAFAHSQGRTIDGLDKVAAKDPAEGERLFLTAPPAGKSQAWQAVLRGLADRDPEAALLRASRNRPDGGAPGPMDVWAVYYRWAGKDPAGAAGWLEKRGTPEERKNNAWTIAEQYAKTDPAAALKWVRGLGLEPDGREGQILAKLAERDPTAALAEMKVLRNEPDGGNEIVSAAWRKNPAAVLAAVQSRTDPEERKTLQTALVSAMAQTDPQAAKDYLSKITDAEGRENAVALIAKELARKDPAAAAQWYLENTGGPGGGGMAFMKLASSYAAKSPQEAMEWTLKLKGIDRLNAANLVMAEWVRQDSAAAIAAVREIADPAERLEMTGRLAGGWVRSDPAGALAWAKTLDGSERVEALLGTAASSWGGKSRNTGKQALGELLRGGALTPGNLIAAIQAARDISGIYNGQEHPPAGEADWVASLPAGAVREQVLKERIMNWSQRDSMAASRWVQEQPPGEVRDLSASELAKQIAPKDPASAFVWAADIGEPERRGLRLLETVQLWQKTNPEAAREAVETSTLPAPEKTRLLEVLKP